MFKKLHVQMRFLCISIAPLKLEGLSLSFPDLLKTTSKIYLFHSMIHVTAISCAYHFSTCAIFSRQRLTGEISILLNTSLFNIDSKTHFVDVNSV